MKNKKNNVEAIEISFKDWELIKEKALNETSEKYDEMLATIEKTISRTEKKILKLKVDACNEKIHFFVFSALDNNYLANIIIERDGSSNLNFSSTISQTSLTLETLIWQQEELLNLLKRIADKKKICQDICSERESMIARQNIIMKELTTKYKIIH